MLKKIFLRKQLSFEDIKGEEIKKLADRLKGSSDKETLTNVLEWQDRNLFFWGMRWYFFHLLLIISLAVVSTCVLRYFGIISENLFYALYGGCGGAIILIIVLKFDTENLPKLEDRSDFF